MINTSLKTALLIHKATHRQKRQKILRSQSSTESQEYDDEISEISTGEDSAEENSPEQDSEEEDSAEEGSADELHGFFKQLVLAEIKSTLTGDMKSWFLADQWASLKEDVKTLELFSFGIETLASIAALKSSLQSQKNDPIGAIRRVICHQLTQDDQPQELTMVMKCQQL
ncbi:hypothetical protein BGX26_011907 [Mortierella sp. AD094]|nr:hypothetical protein BGX26_011907 [Mortierella sp. AD094]